MELSNLHCPAVEITLSSSTQNNKNPKVVAEERAGRSWNPLNLLLRLRTFEAIRYREFRLIWLGHLFVATSQWMDQVTQGWLIYKLTNSTLQLGLVRGIQAIPFLLLSPVAGSAADRYSRKTQLIVAQVMDGLLYATLALLIFTGRIRPWHVYTAAFATASLKAFHQPSRVAMIADAVPSSHLTNAMGLNAIVFNVARIVGPSLAGLLIATFGVVGSYSFQSVFYFLATSWTIQLRPTQPSLGGSNKLSAQETSFSKSIIEGWKFSWRTEPVRAALLVAMFGSLFVSPMVTLLPVYARDFLNVGAPGQGLLLTSMGVGALCSAVLLATFGDRMPKGMIMLGGVSLHGLIVVAFSASLEFQLSLLLMGLMGLCAVTSHALVQTVIQAYSPTEYRGRTSAIFNMNQLVLMVGSTLIGALSSFLGAQWALASMGTVGILAMLAIHIALPRVRFIR